MRNKHGKKDRRGGSDPTTIRRPHEVSDMACHCDRHIISVSFVPVASLVPYQRLWDDLRRSSRLRGLPVETVSLQPWCSCLESSVSLTKERWFNEDESDFWWWKVKKPNFREAYILASKLVLIPTDVWTNETDRHLGHFKILNMPSFPRAIPVAYHSASF